MIEKKIHYIWFGSSKPEKVLKCIESWKEKLPDYEIMEWNEKNFDIRNEIKKNKFFKECYQRKLWAFVADYVRVKVLHEYGGIYLDTDIEVLKSFDDLLNTEMFLGYENDSKDVNLAVIGIKKNHIVMKKMIEFYEEKIWKSPLYIITGILNNVMKEIYGENFYENSEIKIYSKEYFYPYNHDEIFKPECVKENTYTIHWWDKSWGKNPKVYFLKYKHMPGYKKYIKYSCKLINFYFKKFILTKKGKK